MPCFSRMFGACVLAAGVAVFSATVHAQVVISQIYGGTNAADSRYQSDYIELFNRGPAPVNLSGWSVQYCAATNRNWSKTDLSGTIAPGGYFLIQETTGVGDYPIPTPDVANGTINLGTASGKVALVAGQDLLQIYTYFPPGVDVTPGVNGTSNVSRIVDFVGYGAPQSSVHGFEGSGPTGVDLSSTTAAFRKNAGCTDTNDNSSDFDTAEIDPSTPFQPHNSASPTHGCAGVPINGACCLANGTCMYTTASACAAASGAYAGDFVSCAVGSYTVTSISAALIDISSSGDDITGLGGDNALTSLNPLPFPINYYGQTYTAFRADSNGWMTFSSSITVSSGANVDYPWFTAPYAALAPYWDDLTTAPSTTGRIYAQTLGTAPNRQFIVQFDKLPYWRDAGTGNNTSQVIINESSQVIEFRYGTIVANGSSYPGGIQIASFSAGMNDLSSASGVAIPVSSLGAGGAAAARQFTPVGQCPTTGACCRGSVCFSATSLSCFIAAAAYSGDGSTCSPSTCTTGACCRQNGTCDTENPGQCAVNGGVYQGTNQACGATPCPATGACCVGVACSATFSPANGQCAAGSWTSGGACTTNLCAGSCCNTLTYLCSLATSAAACGPGNTFSPLGTTCTTNPCPLPINDDCTGAIAYPVSSLGSTILGGNGSTSTNESPTPPTCIYSTFSRGVWYTFTPAAAHRYEVSTCSPLTTFDSTLYVYSGSCAALTCVSGNVQANPACAARHDAATIDWCAAPNTTYYILVVSVSGPGAFGLAITDLGTSDLCPGTCCIGSACAVTTPTACTSAAGVFQGGASCQANTCAATGVCCRGATCSTTVMQASCTGSGMAGAAFASSASACNGASTTSPCCYANYNKVGGITVQDIFDFLADWFAGSPYANTGHDGAPGPLAVQNIFDFLSAWFAGGCS